MIKPVDYKQHDSKWGGLPYAVDGEKSTIKSAGCGPTAMADVLAAIVSPYIDPLTTASWARMKGYKVYKSGTSYSFPVAIGKAFGVKVIRLNTKSIYKDAYSPYHDMVKKEIDKGNWIIACMGPGLWTSSGHYITVYGLENDKVYINDPASAKSTRSCAPWSTFISQVKYYWVVEVPEQIKKNGIVKNGIYNKEDFVREVQMCLKAGLDGKAGTQTLSKTITVSNKKNRKHPVVLPLQKLFKIQGRYDGALDCIAGTKFRDAVNLYQKNVLNYKKQDGEITAKGKMWRSLLGM